MARPVLLIFSYIYIVSDFSGVVNIRTTAFKIKNPPATAYGGASPL